MWSTYGTDGLPAAQINLQQPLLRVRVWVTLPVKQRSQRVRKHRRAPSSAACPPGMQITSISVVAVFNQCHAAATLYTCCCCCRSGLCIFYRYRDKVLIINSSGRDSRVVKIWHLQHRRWRRKNWMDWTFSTGEWMYNSLKTQRGDLLSWQRACCM